MIFATMSHVRQASYICSSSRNKHTHVSPVALLESMDLRMGIQLRRRVNSRDMLDGAGEVFNNDLRPAVWHRGFLW